MPLERSRREQLLKVLKYNLNLVFGFFHLCLEETSNMISIYPLIRKCFSKEDKGWLLEVRALYLSPLPAEDAPD